jgi:hypothetical protein
MQEKKMMVEEKNKEKTKEEEENELEGKKGGNFLKSKGRMGASEKKKNTSSMFGLV